MMKLLTAFLLLASGAASANGTVICDWPNGVLHVTNMSAATGAHYVGEPFKLGFDWSADWSIEYNGQINSLGSQLPGLHGVTAQVPGLHHLRAFVATQGTCTLTDDVLPMQTVIDIGTSGSLWTATSIPFTAYVSNGVDPKTYLWNFGDGATSTAVSPTHSYDTPGTFGVSVIVTDANGRQASRVESTLIVDNPNVPAQPGPISSEYMGCGTYTATFQLEWTAGGVQPSNYFQYKIRPTTPANSSWTTYWLTQPFRSQSVPLNRAYNVEVSGCISNAAATCGPRRKVALPPVANCNP